MLGEVQISSDSSAGVGRERAFPSQCLPTLPQRSRLTDSAAQGGAWMQNLKSSSPAASTLVGKVRCKFEAVPEAAELICHVVRLSMIPGMCRSFRAQALQS